MNLENFSGNFIVYAKISIPRAKLRSKNFNSLNLTSKFEFFMHSHIGHGEDILKKGFFHEYRTKIETNLSAHSMYLVRKNGGKSTKKGI